MRRYSAPFFACWFFELFLPVPNREDMLGDLIEEYTLCLESSSPSAASRWFWSQVCRSAVCVFWSSLKRENCFISMGVATTVYISMGMLKFATDLIISKLVAPDQATYVVLAPIVFLTTAAIGGCIAARIRRGATIFLSLLVMITVAVLIDLNVCTMPVPWWYQFGFLTLGPLVVLITPAIFRVLVTRREQPAT